MLRTTRLGLFYGLSAIAFAAASEGAGAATAPDPTKLRKHEDLDAALDGRDQPEGWADFTVKQKQEWHGKNPKPAPQQDDATATGGTSAPQTAAGEGTTTVAEATQAATTEENIASTTRANDPDRDATVSNTTTAERLEGVEQEPNSQDQGAAAASGATAPEHNDLQAQGNRHSHPAETVAERSARIAENGLGEGAGDGLASQAFPAGDDADPANQPQPGEGPQTDESSQDESGAIQDATRRAIGAGAGAPDGVGDDGADPSEAEVNDLADKAAGEDPDAVEEVAPGYSIGGGKLRLWRALEKGATRKELLEASGYRSVEGTVAVLAQYSGREIDRTENASGEYVYQLRALPDGDASE